jgi:hypothetical protein
VKGYPTSYVDMFGAGGEAAPQFASIEIPMIQRDYAQGRVSLRVDEIRRTFLDALLEAIAGGDPIGLDFVYGEVNDGRFEPLDGQQRLTTLFLLHWYLAFRTGRLDDPPPWTAFSYSTRQSARLFCSRIVRNPPPTDLASAPSVWLADQHWYLHVWRFDPTIQAMLVMLDAIAERFAEVGDLEAGWQRLTDAAAPAAWFQLLPIDDMGSAADLYIKMNSRGKPLTDFEVFKAQLGQTIVHTGRGAEFGQKIDGPWADLMWAYRGEDHIIDQEFIRYFDFLLEVCEWRDGRIRDAAPLRLERRAEGLLGAGNPRHTEYLSFVFDALDVWTDGADVRTTFESFFASTSVPGSIRLFGTGEVNTNLFEACCERYGEMRGSVRAFSLTDTLLLYATLIHRIEGTDDAARRLRQLRNVNEASQFELRERDMPKFIDQVAAFTRSGQLEELASFNQNQVSDERAKRSLLEQRPELETTLEQLEDHAILRGTLASFDLEPDAIERRAAAFEAAFTPEHWPAVTGALLAMGPYQRDYPKRGYHQFGSRNLVGVWRSVFVDRGDRGVLAPARDALCSLLGALAGSSDAVGAELSAIADAFVARRAASEDLDWRYYLVRYPMMREGDSGIYFGAEQGLGYQLTMLIKTTQRSWYRDPYLLAIWREAGSPEEVDDPWFSGYSTDERWMRLARSRVGLRSVPAGIALQPPPLAEHLATFESLCEQDAGARIVDGRWLLGVRQQDRDGKLIDAEDRVRKGAEFLRALVTAGL